MPLVSSFSDYLSSTPIVAAQAQAVATKCICRSLESQRDFAARDEHSLGNIQYNDGINAYHGHRSKCLLRSIEGLLCRESAFAMAGQEPPAAGRDGTSSGDFAVGATSGELIAASAAGLHAGFVHAPCSVWPTACSALARLSLQCVMTNTCNDD